MSVSQGMRPSGSFGEFDLFQLRNQVRAVNAYLALLLAPLYWQRLAPADVLGGVVIAMTTHQKFDPHTLRHSLLSIWRMAVREGYCQSYQGDLWELTSDGKKFLENYAHKQGWDLGEYLPKQKAVTFEGVKITVLMVMAKLLRGDMTVDEIAAEVNESLKEQGCDEVFTAVEVRERLSSVLSDGLVEVKSQGGRGMKPPIWSITEGGIALLRRYFEVLTSGQPSN